LIFEISCILNLLKRDKVKYVIIRNYLGLMFSKTDNEKLLSGDDEEHHPGMKIAR